MSVNRYVLLGLVSSMCFIAGGFFLIHQQKNIDIEDQGEFDFQEQPVAKNAPEQEFNQATLYDKIKKGENLFHTLIRLGVNKLDAEKFVDILGGEVNLRALRVGTGVEIAWGPQITNSVKLKNPRLVALYVRDDLGIAQRIVAEKERYEDQVSLQVERANIYTEHELISGNVQSSIYQAIVSESGSDNLVNSFSDVFAWQFDFFRETRSGDQYQIIVEKNISEGRFVGYGRVLAAEYRSQFSNLRGFYFESQDAQVKDFFDENGASLKNAFLKAPIKLASISSKFGMRFHPVQKIYKPHNGVDYGAPRNTPIMAVADGRVSRAGYTRFNGNYVILRHANNYETIYLHANRLASKIFVGARVTQGQVIAYVGKTGLASGYHLHFGMKKNGAYVNPAKQIFTRAAGIPKKYLPEFHRKIQPYIIALNNTINNQDPQVALLDRGTNHEQVE